MGGAHIQIEVHGSKPIKLGPKKTCTACAAAGRKRKALEEISPNVRQRAPETSFGCELCKIPLCQWGECWQEHLKQVELARYIARSTTS